MDSYTAILGCWEFYLPTTGILGSSSKFEPDRHVPPKACMVKPILPNMWRKTKEFYKTMRVESYGLQTCVLQTAQMLEGLKF